jgi:uncharacterized membrane protein (DUF485 family)
MDRATALEIMKTPEFQQMVRARRRLVIPLTLLILLAYFGFILTVAFVPKVLGQTFDGGIISFGIMIGFGLLVLSFAIVGFYIHVNNGKINTLQAHVRARAN